MTEEYLKPTAENMRRLEDRLRVLTAENDYLIEQNIQLTKRYNEPPGLLWKHLTRGEGLVLQHMMDREIASLRVLHEMLCDLSGRNVTLALVRTTVSHLRAKINPVKIHVKWGMGYYITTEGKAQIRLMASREVVSVLPEKP